MTAEAVPPTTEALEGSKAHRVSTDRLRELVDRGETKDLFADYYSDGEVTVRICMPTTRVCSLGNCHKCLLAPNFLGRFRP